MPPYISIDLLQVKLVYLSENDDLGWVKHYYNGTWGQLCLVGQPEQQEVDKIGNVVCRQMGLGYSDNSTIATIRESQHNLVTNVKCNGNETALRLCSSTIWETTLDTVCIGQAVWVDCVGKCCLWKHHLTSLICTHHILHIYSKA